MKIRVQSIHFDADSRLLQFIQEKVDKLLQFYDHIIGGEVFLKIDKSSDNKNKIVQIKIQLPGNDILAKEQCKTFEEATDLCMETLSRQIKRHKEKERGV
ncbi:MAG: ribosome-associated translation inhibitor RaiA [Bacteroidetes bacterium]|jgi:putative sigma-54 modulation protein|nr:ribosome-associated translation inhibitor RaiA [Bacteroidota bacterium]MBP6403063.1 ribosome-associated translation inhibitor RaiA [Bacteroidia bacterium]MBK6837463.1 ribosome-associated translation inhibitor RaiA [Bacteroidota bacterium]MBK9525557.1 ribosome-associated translation inhibitor RaiA [Bacteroidota bacterium]MBK9540874.1 ribosome-associated translation inhibitor RaiA [Bacteroidota bacterium]